MALGGRWSGEAYWKIMSWPVGPPGDFRPLCPILTSPSNHSPWVFKGLLERHRQPRAISSTPIPRVSLSIYSQKSYSMLEIKGNRRSEIKDTPPLTKWKKRNWKGKKKFYIHHNGQKSHCTFAFFKYLFDPFRNVVLILNYSKTVKQNVKLNNLISKKYSRSTN